MGQFHCFQVGNSREREHVSNLSGVWGEHSIHIGPDLYFTGVQCSSEYRRCVVGPTSAQGGGFSIFWRADETGNYLDFEVLFKMTGDPSIGGVEIYLGRPKIVIGDYELASIKVFSFNSLLI